MLQFREALYICSAYAYFCQQHDVISGGVVRGDCIECPFHQWQFRGEDGECTHVPYDKPPKGAKLHSYTATEVNGAVWLWFDSEDREPFWDILPVDDIQNGNYRQVA